MMYVILYFVLCACLIGGALYTHIRGEIEIKRIDKEWEELHEDETV